MNVTLIIMAAGMGSRYGGIKQIDPLGPSGEIILDYSVRDALEAGFSHVIFVIRKDIEKAFREKIGNRFTDRISVDYAFQELDDLPEPHRVPQGREKPWGTGHALLACRDIVQEPFVVINADDFYGLDAFRIGIEGLKNLNKTKLEGFLVGYRLANTLSPHGYVTRGVCQAVEANLASVVERFKIGRNEAGTVECVDGSQTLALTGEELVSMNFWGFTPTLFDTLANRFKAFLDEQGGEMKSEYLIPSEVDALIHSGAMTVKVLKTGASWFGVTYPEDKTAVRASLANLVEKGIYTSPLWT